MRKPITLFLKVTLLLALVNVFAAVEIGSFAQVKAKGSAKAKRIDQLMTLYNRSGQFNGVVLVAERGKVIYKRAFGQANIEWGIPNTLDTKFEIASMTKPMTALVIMQLVDEGKIRLDGKVSD